jgi:hypothetical protein
VNSGFRRGVNEVFALLGSYAVLIGSYRGFGTAYRFNLKALSFTAEGGTDRLSRNVSTLFNIPEERRPQMNDELIIPLMCTLQKLLIRQTKTTKMGQAKYVQQEELGGKIILLLRK